MSYKKIYQFSYEEGRKNCLPQDSVQFKCRFCGVTKTQKEFRKKAHAVAECIGNKSIVSPYECDACNNMFSENEENELGKIIKLYKSTRELRGKNGVTKLNKGINMNYNSNNEFSISIESNNKLSNNIYVRFLDSEIVEVEIDNPITVNSILIYRAFVKFALSVVPENISIELETGYKMLRNEISWEPDPVYAIAFNKIIKNPNIAIYQLEYESDRPKYFCTIDVYQIRFVLFLDFDNTCNFIPIECIKSDLQIDKDDIYEIKMCDYSQEELFVPQKEKTTGKIKK